MSETPKHSKLPWKHEGEDIFCAISDELIASTYQIYHDVETEGTQQGNAALIVQAVNSLPLFQEAEKELQDIVGRFAIALEILGNPPKTVEMNTAKAHAVLSRLRAARDQQPTKE